MTTRRFAHHVLAPPRGYAYDLKRNHALHAYGQSALSWTDYSQVSPHLYWLVPVHVAQRHSRHARALEENQLQPQYGQKPLPRCV
jgi:hypothetical protein